MQLFTPRPFAWAALFVAAFRHGSLSVSAPDDVVLKGEIFTLWPFASIVILVSHGSTRLQYQLRQQELGVRGQLGLCM